MAALELLLQRLIDKFNRWFFALGAHQRVRFQELPRIALGDCGISRIRAHFRAPIQPAGFAARDIYGSQHSSSLI